MRGVGRPFSPPHITTLQEKPCERRPVTEPDDHSGHIQETQQSICNQENGQWIQLASSHLPIKSSRP